MPTGDDQLSILGSERGAEIWIMCMVLLLSMLGATIWLLSLTAPNDTPGRFHRWYHRLLHRNPTI